MSKSEREKGRKGEAEVAAIYRAAGFTVTGLEGAGDHHCASGGAGRLRIHSEAKRQETARPWSWYLQATSEAEPGSLPVVAFRRSRSPWLAIVDLETFTRLAALAAIALELDDVTSWTPERVAAAFEVVETIGAELEQKGSTAS